MRHPCCGDTPSWEPAWSVTRPRIPVLAEDPIAPAGTPVTAAPAGQAANRHDVTLMRLQPPRCDIVAVLFAASGRLDGACASCDAGARRGARADRQPVRLENGRG